MTPNELALAKRRLKKRMKECGMWREDVNPIWTVQGEHVYCEFPNEWKIYTEPKLSPKHTCR